MCLTNSRRITWMGGTFERENLWNLLHFLATHSLLLEDHYVLCSNGKRKWKKLDFDSGSFDCEECSYCRGLPFISWGFYLLPLVAKKKTLETRWAHLFLTKHVYDPQKRKLSHQTKLFEPSINLQSIVSSPFYHFYTANTRISTVRKFHFTII